MNVNNMSQIGGDVDNEEGSLRLQNINEHLIIWAEQW